jgi:hypothetical protein
LNYHHGTDRVQDAAVSDSTRLASSASSLGARLEKMLLRQADRRGAPEWIRDVLAGQTGVATLDEESDSRVVVMRPDGSRCEIQVRVTFPMPSPAGEKPWRPRGVRVPEHELAKLSYIVVDEIVDDDADVAVSPWPAVDDRGRLTFSDERPVRVRVSLEALMDYLNSQDVRSGRRPTRLRMGAAFAAVVRIERLPGVDGTPLPPAEWLVPPIYDISAPARDKAKEAFYAAVAPTLRPDEVRAIEEDAADA